MDGKSYYVKDYMSNRDLTVNQSATLKEAVEIMIKEKTNGLVVTDTDKKVVGILSSLDVIKHVVPDYLENEDRLASFEAESVFASRVQEVADAPVESFMTDSVHTAKYTDTLMEAAALMCEHGIRQIPVIDEDGAFVGYVNRTDIKRAIGDVLNIN